ncbi:MAG: glycine dehydrogenase (aminomethyl-transferring) [Flavobacteriaceae bacterium]|nr:glycine dehydrogenase (aminomethyl-transferring) [Flavobacteriaceae bacterium]|tara:strand:- start:2430 stop:5306 length:2877 start_codon:yes stop_codon:yes gene_type:complete
MNTDSFEERHIGPRKNEIDKILKFLNVDSLEQLIEETIPKNIRKKSELNLSNGISESLFSNHIKEIGERNEIFDNYIGLGYNSSILPAVIQRNILENPGWYTAYTPYQAEIAQGRLEALFNFQTVICELTGMKIANASLLDESTSAAEAMTMLYNFYNSKNKNCSRNKFFVHSQVLPQTLSVIETRAEPLGIEIFLGNPDNFKFSDDFFGAILQYPGKDGDIINIKSLNDKLDTYGIKTIIAADLMSLVLLESPGKFNVDVVVGSTQRFGIPLGYGGPHAAYFATKDIYKRNIPGRIIGETKDMDGNFALRMALQTREQHIKRDRATSNICTAQVLLAVMAGMYAVYHGPEGLKFIANKIHQNTKKLEKFLENIGIKQLNKNYFDTIKINVNSNKLKSIAEKEKINFNYIDNETVTISLNETVDKLRLEKIFNVFNKYKNISNPSNFVEDESLETKINKSFLRIGTFMTQSIFNSYHSETALMRYIKNLESKDLALNHSMISLGSCTMKLNAASEMLPLSSPYWNNIHPFAPINQAKGYKYVLDSLTKQLNEITGFYATSIQPNSGAQGEYTGLMVIRAYHLSNGHSNRNICLIPASAHGTNPASAIMAGMKVVVIKTDKNGNIDFDDIKEKINIYKESLAALMITYPSTHGVFEVHIKDITKLIHENGGQVYMDGANMNAQVGLTSPSIIGADVCHLNLHKTFAIPHGGGGPGVGPISVAKHLSDFLPSNPIIKTGGKYSIKGISAAPWGSALACIISYGYIKMLGKKGLKRSTEIAILNANYIKKTLEGAYEILYTGENNRSAHELIIDCRSFKAKKIEVIDIAKRLMDYGFHAPTVSFPVPGTMMIEPTESENLIEIDRFCQAMISIRLEIESDNPEDIEILKNAPHTLSMITSDNWPYKYSRKKAAFPLDFVEKNKFWPSVRRVNEAFGDRNLICSCPSTNDYKIADFQSIKKE